MAILLPARSEELRAASDLSPREIVAELDRHVVGQAAAKRAVAIALRNRIRRQRLPPEVAADITPKNILMIGPTGVGKTEIARRLARLCGSPFLKVEASKFTEVGYVGRDVDSIVRDLVEGAIDMVRREREEEVRDQAAEAAEERLLDLLLPASPRPAEAASPRPPPAKPSTRDKLRELLRAGQLDARTVEMEVAEPRPRRVPGPLRPGRRGDRDPAPGHAARPLRQPQDAAGGSPSSKPASSSCRKSRGASWTGPPSCARPSRASSPQAIVFLDEIDKIAGRERGAGPDVSREGVQRDLLPIVEGTTVTTKHGPVRTDHVLFIAAGAFHVSKPSDLIPELQGRFPIRVELEALTEEDLVRILTEPKNALAAQYRSLLSTDGVELSFTDEAIARAGALRP